MTETELKAQAYDILTKMDQLQKLLIQVNQQIASYKKPEVKKEE